MTHVVSIWLLVGAFAGAGLLNAIGGRAIREDFLRWGYPSWWRYVTGALEILAASLIALPFARNVGLVLGAMVIGAALLTVLRHRAFGRLPPIGLFFALIGVAAISA